MPWLRFLIEAAPSRDDEQNLTKSPKFAAQVLGVLSKSWENLNPSDKSSVASALQRITSHANKNGHEETWGIILPVSQVIR